MSTYPKAYAACLGCYNSGRLKGIWVELNQEIELIQSEIDEMLSTCPDTIYDCHEEWAFHDYENMPSGLSEYESLEDLIEIAEFIEEHGQLGLALLNNSDNLAEACVAIEEKYQGAYESFEDYGYKMLNSLHDIPEYLESYIDCVRYTNDCINGGEVYFIRLGYESLHFFSNR
jgi:antirestriction protein